MGFSFCLVLVVAFVLIQGHSQESELSYGFTPVKGHFKEMLLTADFVVNDGVSPADPKALSDQIYAFLYTIDSVRSPGPKNFKHSSELSRLLADALKESPPLQDSVTVVQAARPGGESTFSGKLIMVNFCVRDRDVNDARQTERMIQDFFSVLENKRNDIAYLREFNNRLLVYTIRVYNELKRNERTKLPVEQQ